MRWAWARAREGFAMKITIRAFADYREIIARKSSWFFPKERLSEHYFQISVNVIRNYGGRCLLQTGELKEFINIFINGRNIAFLDNMGTLLVDGDVIAFFPPWRGMIRVQQNLSS